MSFKIKMFHRAKKILTVLLLCFAMCFSAFVYPQKAEASIQSELTEKQQELKKLEENLAKAKAEKSKILAKLKETEGNLNNLLNEKTKLEVSIGFSETEIDLINKLVSAYEEELVELDKKLQEAKNLKDEKVSQLCSILKYIYENKNVSSLELFFASDNLSDYVAKKEYAKNIISFQEKILSEIDESEKENKKALDEYEKAKVSLEGYKQTIEDKKISVAEDYLKLDTLIEQYKNAKELTEQEYDNILSVEKDYAKDISNVKIDIAELSEYLSNQFIWPLYKSQKYYISSYFGSRNDPFGGSSKEYHNGVDIVVPKGTPILASSGGIVTRSEYASVFGNVVVITHGNGLQTLYCHCSKRLVSVGDKVKQGDVIAQVGSTGRSTGPHLHFSFILNGSYVNPQKYVSKEYFK